jgi:8-oxo-dGTP pyrophosphatase MutT (NUDIX family)
MELCDVLDEFGKRTGRIVKRGTALSPGEYYWVVHVWIKNEASEYLVQKRAAHLASDPGVWATTVGYVWAGEESRAAAIREVEEELGLRLLPVQLSCWDRLKWENRLEDLWLAKVTKHLIGPPALGAEVADWKWAATAELEGMVRRGDFFEYSYLSRLMEMG